MEIAAVVVWKVVDTAEALFSVNDFVDFVHVQSEAAVRNMATGYPYDAHSEGEQSLTSHTAEISEQLRFEIKDRLEKAGVDVLEARVSHLAYSPEIAAAMLQRQQASAVVAARTKIVEGAVGMVEHALDEQKAKNVLDLDDEKRASMVSNLLVVLCSDRHTQPVVNTGTLLQLKRTDHVCAQGLSPFELIRPSMLPFKSGPPTNCGASMRRLSSY